MLERPQVHAYPPSPFPVGEVEASWVWKADGKTVGEESEAHHWPLEIRNWLEVPGLQPKHLPRLLGPRTWMCLLGPVLGTFHLPPTAQPGKGKATLLMSSFGPWRWEELAPHTPAPHRKKGSTGFKAGWVVWV